MVQASAAPPTGEDGWRIIRSQLKRGGGAEFVTRPGLRPTFNYAYSSAALDVNSSVVSSIGQGDLTLDGIDGGFESLAFERKLPIGVRGKSPNLDACPGGSVPVAVESKCTEHLGPHATRWHIKTR